MPNHGPLTVVVDSTSLHLTYSRPTAVTDVTHEVQWAAILGSTWNSAGVTRQILSDDGITRTIRATIPKGVLGQRFVRLRVNH